MLVTIYLGFFLFTKTCLTWCCNIDVKVQFNIIKCGTVEKVGPWNNLLPRNFDFMPYHLYQLGLPPFFCVYVHMELFSKLVLDIEPIEIDDQLFNNFFLNQNPCSATNFEECPWWLLCASITRSIKWLLLVFEAHNSHQGILVEVLTWGTY